MSLDAATNFGYATLAAGIDSDDTSITLTTGHGARLPSTAFNAPIWDTSYGSPTLAYHAGAAEIVRVTARSTDTLTVTRAQEGTTARSFNTSGRTYAIGVALTKATYDKLAAKILTADPMAALAIDVTERLNTKTVSADSTLTFSATPTTGAIFGLRLTEGGGLARTITIPSCYSQARGATITSFTLQANATLDLVWQYDGSTYFIYNDFVTAAQQKTALGITISDVSDLTGELAGKAASTHSHTASEVTDFNSAARAQVEAELVAGTGITLTPSGTGASRQITIAATGASGGGSITLDDGTAATDPAGSETFDDGTAATT